jgi:hypothetical protein
MDGTTDMRKSPAVVFSNGQTGAERQQRAKLQPGFCQNFVNVSLGREINGPCNIAATLCGLREQSLREPF